MVSGDRSLTGSLVLTCITESDDALEDADRFAEPRAGVRSGDLTDVGLESSERAVALALSRVDPSALVRAVEDSASALR